MHPRLILLLALTMLAASPIAASHVKLVVISDSTASNGKERGWGDHLAPYFESLKLTVLNRTRGGRKSRRFFTEGLWERALA